MPLTSASLLERLRQPSDPAWQRFVDLYTPLIRHRVRQAGIPAADGDDLVQDVMRVVVAKVVEFEHQGQPGAFRAWLRAITANRLRDYWRARTARVPAAGDDPLGRELDQLEDPDSSLSKLWDDEHDRFVMRQLLDMIEPEFQPVTWQMFRRYVIDNQDADAVARELGTTANAVFIAKSRVLQRLRAEAAGLIDESSDNS